MQLFLRRTAFVLSMSWMISARTNLAEFGWKILDVTRKIETSSVYVRPRLGFNSERSDLADMPRKRQRAVGESGHRSRNNVFIGIMITGKLDCRAFKRREHSPRARSLPRPTFRPLPNHVPPAARPKTRRRCRKTWRAAMPSQFTCPSVGRPESDPP